MITVNTVADTRRYSVITEIVHALSDSTRNKTKGCLFLGCHLFSFFLPFFFSFLLGGYNLC